MKADPLVPTLADAAELAAAPRMHATVVVDATELPMAAPLSQLAVIAPSQPQAVGVPVVAPELPDFDGAAIGHRCTACGQLLASDHHSARSWLRHAASAKHTRAVVAPPAGMSPTLPQPPKPLVDRNASSAATGPMPPVVRDHVLQRAGVMTERFSFALGRIDETLEPKLRLGTSTNAARMEGTP